MESFPIPLSHEPIKLFFIKGSIKRAKLMPTTIAKTAFIQNKGRIEYVPSLILM